MTKRKGVEDDGRGQQSIRSFFAPSVGAAAAAKNKGAGTAGPLKEGDVQQPDGSGGVVVGGGGAATAHNRQALPAAAAQALPPPAAEAVASVRGDDSAQAASMQQPDTTGGQPQVGAEGEELPHDVAAGQPSPEAGAAAPSPLQHKGKHHQQQQQQQQNHSGGEESEEEEEQQQQESSEADAGSDSGAEAEEMPGPAGECTHSAAGTAGTAGGLTAYELERLERIRRNQEVGRGACLPACLLRLCRFGRSCRLMPSLALLPLSPPLLPQVMRSMGLGGPGIEPKRPAVPPLARRPLRKRPAAADEGAAGAPAPVRRSGRNRGPPVGGSTSEARLPAAAPSQSSHVFFSCPCLGPIHSHLLWPALATANSRLTIQAPACCSSAAAPLRRRMQRPLLQCWGRQGETRCLSLSCSTTTAQSGGAFARCWAAAVAAAAAHAEACKRQLQRVALMAAAVAARLLQALASLASASCLAACTTRRSPEHIASTGGPA